MTERDQYWELARATAIEQEHTRARRHAADNAKAWRERHADADADPLRERRLARERRAEEARKDSGVKVPLVWSCSVPLNGGKRCTFMIATRYLSKGDTRRHLGGHAHVSPEQARLITQQIYG